MANKKVPVIISFEALDKISGPLRNLNKRLENTTAPFKRFRNQVDRFGNATGFTSFVKGAGIAALGLAGAITAGAYALDKFVMGAVESNSKLSEVAERTGVSVESLQKWRFAAEQTGASAAELDDGFTKFSKTLSMARVGKGPLIELLGKDSPFLNQLTHIKGTDKAFDQFMRQLSRVPDEADRITLAMAGMGKSSENLVNLAMLSDEERDKLMAQKEAIGLLDKAQTDAFRRMGDLQKAVGNRFEFISAVLASKLLPVFEDLFGKFDVWLKTNQPTLEKFADMFATVLPPAIDLFVKAIEKISAPLLLVAQHWDQIKTTIDSISNSSVGKIVGAVSKYINPVDNIVPGAGMFSALASNGQPNGPSVTNSSVIPAAPGVQNSGSEATVKVMFENTPRGTRLQTDTTEGMALSVGMGIALGGF